MQFFDDFGQAFKNGLVTPDLVREWCLAAYDDQANALAKIQHCGVETGLVQFQCASVHMLAKSRAATTAAAPLINETPLPAELLRDVPDAVYDEPLPDLAGEIKKRLGIIACVRKFGKPQDRINERNTEGVKVRCPFNDHTDHHPSAWVNTVKNTWYCGKCMTGGDVIDFYAVRQNYNAKTFHKDGSFSEVVKAMGAELGLAVIKSSSGGFMISDDEDEWPSPLPDRSEATAQPEPRSVAPTQEDEEDAGSRNRAQELLSPDPVMIVPPSHEAHEPIITTIDDMMAGIAFVSGDLADDVGEEYSGDEEDEESGPVPSLSWRDLPINPATFLGTWMEYAEEFYPWVPAEFFLFAGLQGVGLAAGHHVTSFTGGKLTGSLMLAMVGPSGSGKSTAVTELRSMFNRIPIVKFNPDLGSGIKIIPSPGSAEAMVKSIYTDVEDAASEIPGKRKEVGATAWLYEDEFATLMAKSSRKSGETMKTRIIQLYDFTKKDEHKSELVIHDFSLASGSRVLHDSYFSAMFTTQTDAVRAMMSNVDLVSGFLNRIIPVMGPQRERRKLSELKVTPIDPAHDKAFENLWRRCRAGWVEVPFTPDALELFDSHPSMAFVERLAMHDSLYSRIQHMTLRLAFNLAINNYETEVDINYIEAACQMVSKYLLGCFSRLRSAVIANEFDDSADRIYSFVKKFFGSRGRWPTTTEWMRDRSYSAYSGDVRLHSLDLLIMQGRLINLFLINGKSRQKVLVIPEDEWSSYADQHNKKFKAEEFYGAGAT